ncbi:MAG: sodium:solute symporter family protein [Bacteroidetes bacterium]|nr:sodium:solute symporter family protein [Bacteroidota bacterium]
MVSFSNLDIVIIATFFLIMTIIGFIPRGKGSNEDYLLSGRKVGLFLFVLTNVATWYGGILGVGEFTYRYGIVSWFTQGLPYYIFAIIFAIFFADKIRKASLFTIPDKITEVYGRKLGLITSGLIFILVSPAPYLLMIGSLLSMIFNIPLLYSLIIGAFFSVIYLFRGGYKADILTDAFEFFIMFIGFIVIVVVAYINYGGIDFLSSNLPVNHLDLTGGSSPTFILVWFLIALWTFADPGFHQRCYSAETGSIAKKGIIISVFFWALFDFLTTSTGLYSRAILPGMENPVISFPLLAEKILGSGLKGLFYAALFATILSTMNSFLFISATTFSNDFIKKLKPDAKEENVKKYTRWGLLFTSIISIVFAYYAESVIGLWYTIGSMCIPGLIFVVVTSYYERFRLTDRMALLQVVIATSASLIWYLLRQNIQMSYLSDLEPMVVGLIFAMLIQFIGKKRVP